MKQYVYLLFPKLQLLTLSNPTSHIHHPVSVNLIQRPPHSPPIAGTSAISACGDTTHRESNMWEDSEYLYIGVCSISDRVMWGSFPSLDNMRQQDL